MSACCCENRSLGLGGLGAFAGWKFHEWTKKFVKKLFELCKNNEKHVWFPSNDVEAKRTNTSKKERFTGSKHASGQFFPSHLEH